MSDRLAPFEAAEFTETRTDSTHREVRIENNNYYGPVNKIEYAENANFGNNYVTLNHPAAEDPQQFSFDQADFIRLLRPILDASHTRDRKTSPPDSACFPGTRTDVIRRIVEWADSSLFRNTHILWLYGYVGCGKSAIALAIAVKFERRERLVGSFFFFRNTGDRSRMIRFATTLAHQLAAAIPEAAPFVRRAVMADPGLAQASLVVQLRRLVYEPFKAAAKRGRLLMTFLFKGPFLIVIDGLDECEDRQDVQAFIDDMLEFFEENPLVPLRFLITSRVEQHIEGRLKNNDRVRLENLINHCLRDDIDTFMTTCFEEEKKRNPVIKAYIDTHGDWPTKKDKAKLVDHINGSFILASALFNYIIDPSDDQLTPMDRLPHALNMDPGLDTLYFTTLSRSQNFPHFSAIISTLALLFEPLPIAGIADLLNIEAFKVVQVLLNLQAIIHIPGTDDTPVTMCHTSLRDFLTTESRSGRFFIPPSFHIELTNHCRNFVKERRSGTAVASYITRHLEKHFQALYPHILAKYQHISYFSDIISTIVLLFEPLSVSGISELLGIETSKVSVVLTSLQVIIDSSDVDKDRPVTIRRRSFHDFLTSKTKSGTFFALPSCHLKLFYCGFRLNIEYLVNNTPSSGAQYFQRYGQKHWDKFPDAAALQSIVDEPKQIPRLPNQILVDHLLSFNQLFFRLFGTSSIREPGQFLSSLTRCVEFLALALECDSPPGRWLRSTFQRLGFDGHLSDMRIHLRIHWEQATNLQRNVQRIETAVEMKSPDSLSHYSPKPNIDQYTRPSRWLGGWTPMDAYRFLEWMNRRIQVGMSPAGPGVTCDFDLEFEYIFRDFGHYFHRITLRKAAELVTK